MERTSSSFIDHILKHNTYMTLSIKECYMKYYRYLLYIEPQTNVILKYVSISENNFKTIIYARLSAKHCATLLHLKETLFLFTTRYANIYVTLFTSLYIFLSHSLIIRPSLSFKKYLRAQLFVFPVANVGLFFQNSH